LVDLGRSLIRTRIHHRRLPWVDIRSLGFERVSFMVRPTRS
jgi:hypothetical protein